MQYGRCNDDTKDPKQKWPNALLKCVDEVTWYACLEDGEQCLQYKVKDRRTHAGSKLTGGTVTERREDKMQIFFGTLPAKSSKYKKAQNMRGSSAKNEAHLE